MGIHMYISFISSVDLEKNMAASKLNQLKIKAYTKTAKLCNFSSVVAMFLYQFVAASIDANLRVIDVVMVMNICADSLVLDLKIYIQNLLQRHFNLLGNQDY